MVVNYHDFKSKRLYAKYTLELIKSGKEYSGISKNKVILHESVACEYIDTSTFGRMGNPLKNYIIWNLMKSMQI